MSAAAFFNDLGVDSRQNCQSQGAIRGRKRQSERTSAERFKA